MNCMLNQKPASLARTTISVQQNSQVLREPLNQPIDEFIDITILLEISLHIHEKPEYPEC